MLDGFVPVTRASELAPGVMTWAVVDRERILVANVDGAFYALQDACGHRQAPLSKGTLEGHVIECPLHFATFDVRTGKLLSGPDRKSTRLNSSHLVISYAVFCLKKKKNTTVNRATSSPDHSPTDSSLT